MKISDRKTVVERGNGDRSLRRPRRKKKTKKEKKKEDDKDDVRWQLYDYR